LRNGPVPLHSTDQLSLALILGAVALAALLVLRNRVIRRRMVFTLALVAGLVAVHFGVDFGFIRRTTSWVTAEELLMTLAAVNTVVILALNPWFSNRVRDGAPAIVQDAIVIGLFVLVGIMFYQQDAKLFATSAIAAAVLGFALQETLGNAFAGLAIQTEKPFRVGHWVAVAGHEGRVTEVTWRATKIRTKDGNLVILPNNVVAREAIMNYTEPDIPSRHTVDVGASYSAPPNTVREALLTAMRSTPHVLSDPKPDVLVMEFGGSAIVYRARFWVDDYAHEDIARDEVRRAIYYEFSRREIEIPFPIQVEYSREETREDAEARTARYTAILSEVPVLKALPDEGRRAVAAAARERMYGDGEVVVLEGHPGTTMFVVERGAVSVTIASGREVARIEAGGYFGEMSLLTGEPRSATVRAMGDAVVLEIGLDIFKREVTRQPEVIERIAEAASERRRELDATRAAAAAALPDPRRTLADRMRRFFGL
jgi:small-conductance mechanosensitive channel